MTAPQHPKENASNAVRGQAQQLEPRSLRTFTPSLAVLEKSSGIYHWTPEGRRLYDYSSGVLVANLGHNPIHWMRRFVGHMGWQGQWAEGHNGAAKGQATEFFTSVAMTTYNAITPVEIQATEKLLETVQGRPGGKRLQQVMWAASGSEAIQKALWFSLARDRTREIILATRFGFHGKKGLANAVTGSETDRDRDPRVRFISFPMAECADVAMRGQPFDPSPYRRELDALYQQFGRRLTCLITEPYLGGGGSYHPPAAYLQMLQAFCREHDMVFILDEVQANFGRTGDLFAYETYGLEPDMVVLGKGLGNGVPVAATVGRSNLFSCLDYGEGSDTWSANPICCASVLATLEEFASHDVLGQCRRSSAIIEAGLVKLKEFPFVAHLRGEKGGMVWGVELRDWNGKTAAEWASAMVLACYRGETGGDGIHVLGPLAKKVVRISPPLVITEAEAQASMDLMHRLLAPLVAASAPAPKSALVGAS